VNDLCLAIDLGTGGPKIGLVSLSGEVLDYELRPVATEFTDDGGATQDPELWWTFITEATRRLMARPDVMNESVRAIAVTGQYASTVPVDAAPVLGSETIGVPSERLVNSEVFDGSPPSLET